LPPANGKLADLGSDPFNILLQSRGLTLPRQALVESATEAAQKAKALGFPVAMKLIAPEVIHKTESGAVVLGLDSPDDVEAQGKRLLGLAKGSAKLLVQEMVEGSEILLGARTDPQYGPFMIVGLGGIFVEVIKDVAVRLLPVSEKEARAMLKELKGYKVLEGVRGQPPRDTAALVKAMVGLSDIFLIYRDHLSDLEFNPIMLRAEGQGLAAVDVRMIRS
jgi:succinyl-CoA synthetase beta subunit